jgi:hypothetical protein
MELDKELVSLRAWTKTYAKERRVRNHTHNRGHRNRGDRGRRGDEGRREVKGRGEIRCSLVC